jgi:hypothetical protein
MSTTLEPAAPAEMPRPATGPIASLRRGLKALASLQLTVVLFSLAMGLVFFGTVAQVDYGIWTVVDKYFWSWIVWVPFDIFNKFGQVFFDFPKEGPPWKGSFPFPGGKLLGGAMLLNLLAAHLVRFRITWKRSGILLIHSGLILLFVGEFITREFAIEQVMSINQGESVNYTQDSRHYELAFMTKTATGQRDTVIPENRLTPGSRITHEDLPVDVEVVQYMKNANYLEPTPSRQNPATAGSGLKMIAEPMKEESGVSTEQREDIPAAYVTLYRKGTNESLGTFLVSRLLTYQGVSEVVPGTDGKVTMALRNRRYYKPFSLHLIEFRHDKYIGTDLPKNFSSRVVLLDPEQNIEREVVISMNQPLRHRGETFYQADFDKRTEKTTHLQVVRNPGWLLPYISCAVMTLGMLVHFGIYLTQFLVRRAAA